MGVLDIIIGAVVIVFCSRRQIEKISRMKRTTYRDIMKNRHG